jgi:hypothetical protein
MLRVGFSPGGQEGASPGFRVRSEDDLKHALWLMRLPQVHAEDSE